LTPVSRIKEIESIQFKEKTMRIITVVALFAVMLAGTAFAGDSGNGCKLQGTWTAEVPYPHPTNESGWYWLKFYETFHGTGDNEGTVVLDFINPVPGTGYGWSPGRGNYEKVGPNKYSYTMDVYVYDTTTGDIVGIGRHVAMATLKDCNTIEVNTAFETGPGMTDLYCLGKQTWTLHRILPREPCCKIE
jgi:hypothetical protein